MVIIQNHGIFQSNFFVRVKVHSHQDNNYNANYIISILTNDNFFYSAALNCVLNSESVSNDIIIVIALCKIIFNLKLFLKQYCYILGIEYLEIYVFLVLSA